jgi:autotransporter-associated beta strand protein
LLRLKVELLEARAVPATITWTGQVSNLWQDPRNWLGGLPGTGDDVVIGSSLRPPVLNGIAQVRNVTVGSAGQLTIASDAILNIGGSIPIGGVFENFGTTTIDRGTVYFGIISQLPLTPGFINRGLLTAAGPDVIIGAFHNDGGTVQLGTPVASAGFQRLFSNTGSTGVGTIVFDLNGLIPGIEYDQVVNFPGPEDPPTITFLGGQVTINAQYNAAIGTVFRIIDNQGTGAISGTFDGLPEGATLMSGAQQFRISYVGGDGNDVTLTREPALNTSYWDGQPDSGGASNDNLWSNPTNWFGDVAPMAGASLVFPASVFQTTNVNDFPVGTSFGSLSLVGSDYQISGNAAEFAAGASASIVNGSSTLALPLGGAGGLTKWGNGTLVLSGPNTYGGDTVVVEGTLDLAGAGATPTISGDLVLTGGTVRELLPDQISDTSAVRVGFTMAGAGSTFNLNGQSDAVGTLTVAGGTVLTGGGQLTAGDTTFDPQSILSMNLVDAASSDRLTVNGLVSLAGALQLALPVPVPLGTQITLIDNDGTDPVAGIFTGHAEGTAIAVNGSLFRITYHGGTNQNDVVITAISPMSGEIAGFVYLDVNGNGQSTGDAGRDGVMVHLDVGADGTVDRLAITANGGLYRFDNLPTGTHRVRIVVPNGMTQTTNNPFDLTLAVGQIRTGVDFGLFELVSISGTKFNDRNGDGIRNNNEPGVGGVEIKIFPAGGGPIVQTVVTNADGSFTLTNIGPGRFEVQETAPEGTTQTTPDPAPITTSSGANVSGLMFGNRAIRVEQFAVAEGSGGQPRVDVYDSNGHLSFSFLAYDAGFTGGVRVATGDVNGDGWDDIVTAAGAGGGPHIKVFDGTNQALLQSFLAYSPSFTGGVFVAAGDVNHDGFADIVTGAGTGGGPHVEVFSGANLGLLKSFFAYAANFTGGVRVAAADVNGDRFADIVTGAGNGGGPHVEVFSGANLGLIKSIIAYDPVFTGGVYVAAGDVDADGRADIIVGAGDGGGPHVKVFAGTNDALIRNFFAYDPNFRGGVRVAAGDMSGDGTDDIITGAGASGGPHVKAFDATSLGTLNSFMAFDPAFLGGVFVG